jgi:hypothetical protein
MKLDPKETFMSSLKTHSTIIVLLIFFMLVAFSSVSSGIGEKEIPSQDKLDACFAGGFNMSEQMNLTYTQAELEGLDRALKAMGMTRHDMDFRKDYTEAHLAFPLILDMMKHPLNIAPYMDGFDKSIQSLKGNEVFAVPDVLACAMTHPGIKTDGLPNREKLLFEADMIGKSAKPPWAMMNPCPSEPFHYVLNSFSLADRYAQSSFKDLTEEEFRILRLKIPWIITWHDVFKSPYSEAETEKMNKMLEELKNDAYIDELATKVNLDDMLMAYISLPNPEILMKNLKLSDFPQSKPEFYDTPWGKMAIGTPLADFYTGDYAIIIDPAGDDAYENCRIGAAFGTPGNFAGFFLDMDGKDSYFCKDTDITLGASVMGVAAFYDMGNDNDKYYGGNISLGATACGIASFLDDGGSDEYFTKVYGQGAAGYGVGVMVDKAPELVDTGESPANQENEEIDESGIQNNRFEAWLMGQGFSRQWGVGLCHGSRGNDIYHAGGVYLHAPLFNDRYQSFSQGFSIGSRDIDYAGGIAFIIEENGNDYYLGDIYNQGVGYWYSGGFVLDKGGNDHYEMTQYGQGSGIHLAVGGVIDNAGNDSYTMNSGLGQGGSHDFAASVMMDRGGLDRYVGSTSCNGCGLTNSVGLFFERNGNDIYGADPNAGTLGGGRWARDTGSIGVFVDTGGDDSYVGQAHDNRLWTQTTFGAGLDFKPEDTNLANAPTGQADQPSAESQVKIPEICSYKGELTDEVFKELWEISVRWEVGDNRWIVPKARERLIAFGIQVLPKIDEVFNDTTSGLATRAYEVIIPELYKTNPEEVRAMLVKNLASSEDGRPRNALSLVGTLKITELGDQLVPLLEDEKLRGTAIMTLGSIDSKAGDERLKQFLAPDQGERLILIAAANLLKLGEYDIYPQLRILLDHEFFTVREGIATMISQNYDKFHTYVYDDLNGNSINTRTRISLLRVVQQFPEFFPSVSMYAAVSRSLDSEDWVLRSHTVLALKHWQTYKGEEWNRLKETINERLNEMKKTETDFHVLYLIDKEPEM